MWTQKQRLQCLEIRQEFLLNKKVFTPTRPPQYTIAVASAVLLPLGIIGKEGHHSRVTVAVILPLNSLVAYLYDKSKYILSL